MKKYVVGFVFLVLIFGGLSSVRELTDLAIVKAVSIDLTDDGRYEVNAIIIDTSQKENKNKGKIISAYGNSVHEAARNMVDISSKKLYIAHMESLIISEDISKNNFENTLDFFIRDNEGSNSFFLFVAKGEKASKYLELLNEGEEDLVSFLKSTQKYKGSANIKTLNDNLKEYLDTGISLCVNTLQLENDKVAINGMAYFKDNSLKGYLSEEESVIYNTLINEVDNTLFSIGENDNDFVVVEVVNPKVKISIDNNIVNIKVKMKSHITQNGTNLKLDSLDDKKVIEEKFKNEIEKRINDLYDLTVREKVDIIGIGNILYRNKNNLINDEDYLEKLKINVNIDFKIVDSGGIRNIW